MAEVTMPTYDEIAAALGYERDTWRCFGTKLENVFL